MTGRFSHFKNTIAGFLIGLAIVFFAFVLDKDFFDYVVDLLRYLEHFEIDEIIVAGMVILVGLVIDLAILRSRRERYIELQEQRVRVLKSTMRTVQDIVNNFLNNLVFFRLEAETRGALSESSLETMDSLIRETSAKLTALGNLDEVPEKPLAGGLTGIDLDGSPPAPGFSASGSS